jgi:DeoD family purine-nucleoside phosphorylase
MAILAPLVAADPIHIRPTAELAERVLLPGDPGRALLLAQTLLDEPRMFNHHRGLWGYTGSAADGSPLTIQSTGMGGPSAAIVVEELVALGAARAIRVGTCGALAPRLELGSLVICEHALACDGASRALGVGDAIDADPALTAALSDAAPAARAGTTVSADLFYDPDEERVKEWSAAGVLAVEMEAAAVLAVAARHGVRAACILAVSDLVLPERRRIDDQRLARASEQMGRVALAALGPTP